MASCCKIALILFECGLRTFVLLLPKWNFDSDMLAASNVGWFGFVEGMSCISGSRYFLVLLKS